VSLLASGGEVPLRIKGGEDDLPWKPAERGSTWTARAELSSGGGDRGMKTLRDLDLG